MSKKVVITPCGDLFVIRRRAPAPCAIESHFETSTGDVVAVGRGVKHSGAVNPGDVVVFDVRSGVRTEIPGKDGVFLLLREVEVLCVMTETEGE